MAVFLCHSRKAHDQYYCMNVSHPGLINAFKQLENFQADPEQLISCDTSTSQNSQLNNQVQVNLSICEPPDSVNGRTIDSPKGHCFASSTPLCSPIRSTSNQPSSANSLIELALEYSMESRESNSNESVLGQIVNFDFSWTSIDNFHSHDKDKSFKMKSLQIAMQKMRSSSKEDSDNCLIANLQRSRPSSNFNLTILFLE